MIKNSRREFDFSRYDLFSINNSINYNGLMISNGDITIRDLILEYLESLVILLLCGDYREARPMRHRM
jgi:hypothetical protein